MKSLFFEKWCSSPNVRVALSGLLDDAANLLVKNQHVLQINGEPFNHDANTIFIYIQQTLSHYRQPYIAVADPLNLPFTASQFDIILLLFPYEIMGNDERWLMEAKRVLKEDGFLGIFGINPLSLDGVCDRIGIKRFPEDVDLISPQAALLNTKKQDLTHVAHYSRALPWSVEECEIPGLKKQVLRKNSLLLDWPDGAIILDLYQIESYSFIMNELVIL